MQSVWIRPLRQSEQSARPFPRSMTRSWPPGRAYRCSSPSFGRVDMMIEIPSITRRVGRSMKRPSKRQDVPNGTRRRDGRPPLHGSLLCACSRRGTGPPHREDTGKRRGLAAGLDASQAVATFYTWGRPNRCGREAKYPFRKPCQGDQYGSLPSSSLA